MSKQTAKLETQGSVDDQLLTQVVGIFVDILKIKNMRGLLRHLLRKILRLSRD